jgi:hypothetical protein
MTFCCSLYVFSIELLWNGTKILICDTCLAHHVDTYNYESTNTNQTIRSLHIKSKRLFTYQEESKPKTLCDNKQIIHKCLILHLGPILLKCTKILSQCYPFLYFLPNLLYHVNTQNG